MYNSIVVHHRVMERHPEITREDVITAWRNAIVVIIRNYTIPDIYAAAGMDSRGRMLEMLGIDLDDGTLMIYHAMKLTRKMRRELGL